MGLNDNFSYDFKSGRRASTSRSTTTSTGWRRALPDARFIVVEPFWYTDARPGSVEVIIGWVHECGRSASVPTGCPAPSHWIEGPPGVDGVRRAAPERRRLRRDGAADGCRCCADPADRDVTTVRLSRAPNVADVALIGGGIMSATLGRSSRNCNPTGTIQIYERLSDIAQESSNPWNNAGTGHSALCELNYTPERADGSIDITKRGEGQRAVPGRRASSGRSWCVRAPCPSPATFINPVPHMSFVLGRRERRVPPQALRGAQGPPAVRGHASTSEDAERHPLLGPADDPGPA